MSRNKTKTKKALRAFLAASSGLVLITAVAPLADAAGGKPDKQSNNGNGKSEVHGKGHGNGKSEVHSKGHGKGVEDSTLSVILKTISNSPLLNGRGKKFENNGNALVSQSRALTNKLTRLGSANPAIAVALTAFISSMDTATATMQLTIKTAQTTYKSALDAATTDTAKQSAKDAYTAAITAAHQTFSAAMQAATLALKAALSTLATLTPAPTPGPSTSPSPSPSPSST